MQSIIDFALFAGALCVAVGFGFTAFAAALRTASPAMLASSGR